MQFKSTETFPSLRHKSVRIKFHYCEYTKHSPLKIRIKLTHRRTKEIFPVHEENETKRERERGSGGISRCHYISGRCALPCESRRKEGRKEASRARTLASHRLDFGRASTFPSLLIRRDGRKEGKRRRREEEERQKGVLAWRRVCRSVSTKAERHK